MSSRKKPQVPHLTVVPDLNKFGFVLLPLEGKKPIVKRWNTLTATPDKLFVFEGRNIGILTGRPSGLTVLDIDVKDDGMTIWNNISTSYPAFNTPIATTPNGGIHIYFQYNKHLHSFSRFKLRDRNIGWDLLNDDRLVVAPPSIHPKTNKKYKWIVSPHSTKVAPMPKWLESYLINVKSISK